jgi:hypothetical protein
MLAKEMLVLTQQLLYNILSARLKTYWQTLMVSTVSTKADKSLIELEEAHDKYLNCIHSYIFPEQVLYPKA